MCKGSQYQSHHHHECACGGDCECGEHGCRCDAAYGFESRHLQRRYPTKAEQIAELETYLKDLKLEAQAVEEMLVDLRKS
jgi:hypothetical protein